MGRPSIPRSLRLTPLSLAIAVLLLLATDVATRIAGNSVLPGGPLDETAHFLTVLLVLWAIGWDLTAPVCVGALVASVAIDIDHIPDRLGVRFLTAGTPRPYTHSLLTIAVVLVLAVCWRRRRELLLGVALGLGLHFWRDLADTSSGVSLLWPITDHAVSLPHASYAAALAGVAIVAAYRCYRTRVAASREALARGA